MPQTGLARTPDITIDTETGMASTEITVRIYNVAGLPWPLPLDKGRGQALAESRRKR